MQNILQTNGNGLPAFPQDVAPLDVTIWMHDSGMLATHNCPCPVCRESSAVLDLSCGLMKPCWDCQKNYVLIKNPKSWFKRKLLGYISKQN